MNRIFEYFGAHRVANRVAHERTRGWQRVLIATLVPPLALLRAQDSGAAYQLAIGIAIVSAAYGLASLFYLAYLRRRPTGGVAVQYLFTVFDSLLILATFMQDPRFFASAHALLVVCIIGPGFRYGERIAWLTWSAATVWYLVLLPFTPNLRSQLPLLLAVPVTLMFVPPLIWPSIRRLQATRALEVEQARVQALSQAAAARTAFVATVSHELRSPLQSVIWAVDAFEKSGVHHPAQSEFVITIRRAVNLLTRQLRDMLTLERSESGQLEIYPSAFDFCALIEDVGAAHRDLALSKGLELSIHVPEEPLFVVADSSRIDQVLTNLVANAIRYTDAGQVRITLEPYCVESKTVRFSVSDTGRGIAEGMHEVIFQRHRRLAASVANGNEEGTGLGLAVVRGVVAQLGGSVAVSSAPGEGAVFTIEIPAQACDPEAQAGTQLPAQAVFLVVDDDPGVLTAVAGILQLAGYPCDVASSPAIAANMLACRLYTAALIDLDMPVKNGAALAAEIRRGDGLNKTTRLVAFSAAEAMAKEEMWPFDAFITKPVERASLLRVLVPPVPERSFQK